MFLIHVLFLILVSDAQRTCTDPYSPHPSSISVMPHLLTSSSISLPQKRPHKQSTSGKSYSSLRG